MNIADISQLIAALNEAGIERMEYAEASGALRIELAAGSCARTPAASYRPDHDTTTELRCIGAPFAGIFRVAHPADRQPLVAAGMSVTKGQMVGFLETGLLLRPVTSQVAGTVVEVLAADGVRVGFGHELIRLDGENGAR